jgi:hypothetical protein
MQRSLICRAKSVETGEWVYGYFFLHEKHLIPMGQNTDTDRYYILSTGFADWKMPRPMDQHEVDIDTLCQDTGFKDAQNNSIFEKDILDSSNTYLSPACVNWGPSKPGFFIDAMNYNTGKPHIQMLDSYWAHSHTVIGNIFDNEDIL